MDENELQYMAGILLKFFVKGDSHEVFIVQPMPVR